MATGNDEKIPQLLGGLDSELPIPNKGSLNVNTEGERFFPEEPFVPHWQDLVYPNDGVL